MDNLQILMNQEYNERYADKYDHALAWRDYLINTYRLATTLSKPQPGEIILDAPIGTGGLARILVNQIGFNGRLYGVDLSKAMLKKAREKLADSRNISLSECDITKMPFENNVFDRVYSLNSLHYLPYPESFLNECIRVLKPNGLLTIVDLDRSYLTMNLAESFFKLNPSHKKMYKKEELETLLKAAGFFIKDSASEKPGVFWAYYGVLAEKTLIT